MENFISNCKTACAYIRVSTDKQDELSPDAQKRLLLEYAHKHNIFILDKYIFLENGISGKKADNRPEFMKMIGLAKSKEHPFDVILVWKYSRFARNQEESIVYKSLLKRNHVEVVSISEPLIDGPFGSLIERIIEWMDEYYSIRLSGEVIRGMTEKAMRGGYQANPPIGYRMNSKTKIPYIVKEEKEVVEKIFNDFAYKNRSCLEIARELNSLGYQTGRGKKFEQRTVRYILENPFYIGKIRWNRQNRNDHTIKDPSKWIISDGKHEKIIDEQLYYLVQKKIQSQKKVYKVRSIAAPQHWLSGMVRCSACGHTLVACSRGKQPGACYFQCSAYNKGSCSISHSIHADKLEESIIAAFNQVFNVWDNKYILNQNFQDDSLQTLSHLEQQIKKIHEKGLKIKQAYLEGIDTISEYESHKKLLSDELINYEKQISKTKVEMEQNTLLNREYRNLYEIVKNSNCDINLRRNALQSVVNKIIFNKPDNSIDIYFSQP